MCYNFETKWKRNKIENLLSKYEVEIDVNAKSNNRGSYTGVIRAYNKGRYLYISVYKTSIRVSSPGSYYKGIVSYRKLENVLRDYSKEIKRDIMLSLSRQEINDYLENN